MLQENLRALRKARGLTQEELAIRLNVVRQTVSKWEKGLSVPDAEMLMKIADILETTVVKLLGARIEEEPNSDLAAEQLARIAEQLAIRNRRARRIWRIVGIAAGAFLLLALLLIVVNVWLFQAGWEAAPEVRFEPFEAASCHVLRCIYPEDEAVDGSLRYELDSRHFGIFERESGEIVFLCSVPTWQPLPDDRTVQREWNVDASLFSGYEERLFTMLPGARYLLMKLDGHLWVTELTDRGTISAICEIERDDP